MRDEFARTQTKQKQERGQTEELLVGSTSWLPWDEISDIKQNERSEKTVGSRDL